MSIRNKLQYLWYLQVKSFLVEMNVAEQTATGLEKNGVNGKLFVAGLTMDALREYASKGDIQVLLTIVK